MVNVRVQDARSDDLYVDLVLPAVPPVGTVLTFVFPREICAEDEFKVQVGPVEWYSLLPDAYLTTGKLVGKHVDLRTDLLVRAFVESGWKSGDPLHDPFEPSRLFDWKRSR